MFRHNSILFLAGVAALGLNQSAKATISTSTSATTAWTPGTIAYETGDMPTDKSGGTSTDNDNWGGNANGLNGFGALAQAFVPSVSGTLSTIEMTFAGSAVTFNVELYNYGGAPPANFPDTSPGGAPIITQFNSVPTNYPNLLTAGEQFTFNGTAGQTLETLAFGGADAGITLTAGNLYILSLDPTANADNAWWVRGGTTVAGYDTGEGFNADGPSGLGVFEGKSSIRDFDTAVTVAVPEPASLSLLGIATIALLGRRCRGLLNRT